MTAVLDDQVRLMESNWFMSYPHDVYARTATGGARLLVAPRRGVGDLEVRGHPLDLEDTRSCSRTGTTSTSPGEGRRHRRRRSPTTPGMPRTAELRRVAGDGPVARRQPRHGRRRASPLPAQDRRPRVHAEGDQRDRGAGPADRGRAVRRDPRGRRGRLRRHRRRAAADDHDRVDARRSARATSTTSGGGPTPSSRCREDTLPSDDDADLDRNIADIIEFREYFSRAAERPRRQPARRPAHQADPGGVGRRSRSTLEEQLSMAQILLIAGNETTRGLLAGAGQALAEHPDQRRHPRRSRPSSCPARSRSSCGTSRRSRTCAAPRSTTSSSAGSRSAAATSSACSTRRPTATRTHGSGPTSSTCGATPTRRSSRSASPSTSASARAWRGARARIVLTELLARFPNYELVGDTIATRQHMTPGIKTMPVVFRR